MVGAIKKGSSHLVIRTKTKLQRPPHTRWYAQGCTIQVTAPWKELLSQGPTYRAPRKNWCPLNEFARVVSSVSKQLRWSWVAQIGTPFSYVWEGNELRYSGSQTLRINSVIHQERPSQKAPQILLHQTEFPPAESTETFKGFDNNFSWSTRLIWDLWKL